MKRTARAARLCAGSALLLGAAGCGSAASRTSHASNATQVPPAVQPLAAAPPRVTILSPRAGARTGSTLTVRVAVSGEPGGNALRLRYVLDRKLVSPGASRLTLHELAPGRHSLEVLVLAPRAGRAHITFTVRAPRHVTLPAAQPTPTVAAAPPPTPVAAPTTQTTHTTSTPMRAPAPTTTTTTPSPPPAGGGIPQGGGGDGDGDNSGGPSDGDGNL
jgi:hypothetical protein